MKKIDLSILKRKLNYDTLIDFGFVKEDNSYLFQKDIIDGDFKVVIKIVNEDIFSYVIDNEFDEEFTNVDVNTSGEFIGTIKSCYDDVINSFYNSCTYLDLNYNNQVLDIINYINDKYHDDIEYLWEKTPDSGIFRNKKNNKWYAAILSVKEDRVGGLTDNIIMVIDLMYYKGETFDIVDNKNIYPGYHMNKNSWITIRLDNSVDNSFIYKYIDISYELSIKK
jgi:predicted DNA-binding protein (MmcQ/YjbR family)